ETVHVTSSETTSKNGWKSPCSQAAKASAISFPFALGGFTSLPQGTVRWSWGRRLPASPRPGGRRPGRGAVVTSGGVGGDGGEDVEAGGPAGGAHPGQDAGHGPGDDDGHQPAGGDREAGDVGAGGVDQGPAEEDAEADAAERPEDGDDDRLPAEHGPHLPAGLAPRPEHAD